MRQISLAILALIITTGCAQQPSTTYDSNSQTPTAGPSVLSSLRPKADPAMVAEIRQEESNARDKAIKLEKDTEAQQQQADTSKHDLPDVSQSPMAPPAEQVVQQSKNTNNGLPFWPFNAGQQTAQAVPIAKPPAIAGYGGYSGGTVPPPPPEAASSSGLVPPPPAVSLSTQAQTMPYGLNPQDPYGSMYGNQQVASQAPSHASGSLFGSGGRQSSDNQDETSETTRKKAADFTPITPTGMAARSPYKQRDDLKALLKGAISNSALGDLATHDAKIATAINKLDVGLPAESSKGAFNVSQRQLDTLYKSVDLDKHIAQPVKKIQTDITQAYYRYLYAYNKFALAQQTVAARKQEVDMADSASEQQRSTTDLSQAQNDADQSRDDMRSAQTELASVAGSASARSVITRVSGVAPSTESLNVAEHTTKPASRAPNRGGFFHPVSAIFGKSSAKDNSSQPQASAAQVGAKTEKSKNKKVSTKANEADLAPSPTATQMAPVAVAKQSSEPIAFELKNVNVTPRKSVLKVAVRNNGSNNFTFDPDVISISEGNHKLSDATIRADFDSTLVQPNQEITGTITIFGHPWSDRLSIDLSDGTRTIQLKH